VLFELRQHREAVTNLEEQNLSLSGSFSEDDYIRIGNLTNTQYMLAGSITKAGNGYILDLGISGILFLYILQGL
jgi:hypothetical protein